MQELQLRLQEPSTVVKAAEGQSEEAQMLARDTELSAIIKSAKEEQDAIRLELKERYKQTGERFRLGDIEYRPTEKTTFHYNTATFRDLLGSKADPYLTVDATKVAKALEIGALPMEAVEASRTATVALVHGTGKVKE